MPRKPEQVEADDMLTEAIKRVMQVYDMNPQGLLTGYVVFTAHQGIEDEGAGNTRIDWMCMDDGMPWHHIIGLVRMGSRMVDRDMEEGWRPDDEEEP
jgi:hypothetical protein